MPEFNGSQPFLRGVLIQSLLCQEYWYNGLLDQPANIVYLQVRDIWHRLYFDCGVIFWRDDGTEGMIWGDEKNDDSEFRTIDLLQRFALGGRTIADCTSETVNEHGSKVTFQFDGGGALSFVNVNDQTVIEPILLPDRGT